MCSFVLHATRLLLSFLVTNSFFTTETLNESFLHQGRRKRLVQELASQGITDQRVLTAIGEVPRQVFVEGAFSGQAYENKALPIKSGQTISQPFTVAFQTQLLKLKPNMKVLEVGTGSGYQAAVLCAMGMRVFTVEIDEELYRESSQRLQTLGYEAYQRCGDGSLGWNRYKPFDAILVTAASPQVPHSLKYQLEQGGRLVIPVGDRELQEMTVLTRTGPNAFQTRSLQRFKFVPLRGKHGFP